MKQWKKRVLSGAMAAVMTASTFAAGGFTALAGDTLPMLGEEARKAEQPKFSGYRIWDISQWSPETDPYAEFLRADIPLQERIDAFKPTQANPELDSDAQIMLMQGDYGNVFVDGMMYNNTFLYHTLNFWQYTDYYSPWHGAITAKVPESIWDWEGALTDPDAWMKRRFEFGILNIPNPAYTNAAHKNGVKSIACIYFDQSFREGQTIDELFRKDENGKFIVAEKLIEMAEYFGYDGYFFNCEEAPDSREDERAFLARLTEAGLWTQYYDTNSSFNERKAEWLAYDIDGDGEKEKLQDSVFVNYGWPYGIDDQIDYIKNNGYDPFEQVFYGVEANQGKFSGSHGSVSDLPSLYAEGTKNPRASIALFTPSDYYHRGVDDVKGGNPVSTADPDYMWMVAERERMYFSGVTSDPTDTGKKPGYSRPDVGVSNAGGWVGVADFTSERSVIDGSVFYTNFNTGKGRSYWTDGKLTNGDDWTNISVQDILPTWQWWITVPEASEGEEPYAKLKADFDYGERYYTGATEFTHIGAYNGGSSLVVAGDLEAENLLRLYKTELSVNESSKIEITYQKPSASDGSEMKLALIFKEDPENVVYLPIAGTGTKTTEWKTASVSLGKYAGKEIATIGLAFTPKQGAVSDYQMNIGAIRLTDGANHTPAIPEAFKVDRAFSTDEMIATWKLGDFNTVDKYEIYATLSNGKKLMVGTNFADLHYIKTLEGETENVTLSLVAIGKDGSRSEAATTSYNYAEKVGNLKADTEVSRNNFNVFTKRAGVIDLTWTEPKAAYESVEFTVTMDDSTDDTTVVRTVPKGTTSVSIPLMKANGEKYQVAARTVFADGTKSEPIMLTGYMKDVWSQPFDPEGKVFVSGTSIEFWQPASEDWYKMYVSFNGETLQFTARFNPERNYITRGGNKMYSSLPDTTGTLKIVLEDYTGNMSEPVYYTICEDPTAEITSEMFPDPVLLEAVKEQVGMTMEELLAFNGTLDLSGKAVEDLTGLSAIGKLTALDLSGTNIKEISKGQLPKSLTSLDLSDCKALTRIDFNTFAGLDALKSIDITGCTALQVLGLNNSALEMVEYGDASALKELISVTLENSRFDLTEGTPMGEFVKAVAEITKDKEDIVLQATELSNLGPKASIDQEKTTLGGCEGLFDGETSVWDGPALGNVPGEVVFTFDSPQTIAEWKLLNGSYGGLKSFELQYSVDGKEWKTLGVGVTGNEQVEVTQKIQEPEAARFYKLVASEKYGPYGESWMKVVELYLYGYETTLYEAGVKTSGQRPAVYVSYPEEVRKELGEGTLDPQSLIEYKTVSGTSFASLKGAAFIAEDYDIDAQMKGGADLILVNEDPNGVIALDHAGVYTVKFVNFGNNANGDVHTTIVSVGDAVKPVDKDALISLIQTAENMDLTPYTQKSADALNEALKAAKAVAANEQATQEEVDKAYAALENAINALEKKGEEVPDTGDRIPYELPVILMLAAVSVFVMKKRLMR